MKSQQLNLEKKKRGRPATGRGVQVNSMLQLDLVAAIDKFSADEPDRPGRTETVRRLLQNQLIGLGYLESPTGTGKGK